MNAQQIESGIGSVVIAIGGVAVTYGWLTKDQVSQLAEWATLTVGVLAILVPLIRKMMTHTHTAVIAVVNDKIEGVKVVGEFVPAPRVIEPPKS